MWFSSRLSSWAPFIPYLRNDLQHALKTLDPIIFDDDTNLERISSRDHQGQ